MRSLIIPFLAFFILNISCKKANDDTSQVSNFKVKKDDVEWVSTSFGGHFNAKDDMMSVTGGKDLETFGIWFKKPTLTDHPDFFDAYSLFAPAPHSAAVINSYHLDETQPNKLRIYIIDELKNRVAGEFILYLKRDEQYGSDETHVYQGKFDVYYKKSSF